MDHRGDGWFLGSLEVFKGAAGFVYFTFHFQIEKQTPTLDNNTSSGDGWFLGSSEAFKDAADFFDNFTFHFVFCFSRRSIVDASRIPTNPEENRAAAFLIGKTRSPNSRTHSPNEVPWLCNATTPRDGSTKQSGSWFQQKEATVYWWLAVVQSIVFSRRISIAMQTCHAMARGSTRVERCVCLFAWPVVVARDAAFRRACHAAWCSWSSNPGDACAGLTLA